jgi:prepilin-type N-terminal cleavage/methylation domain-containing protein
VIKSVQQKGFTIVELLIVIVVIGILAAITIVAYNGIQDRARISSVSSALSQASKKLAIYQVDNPDLYPADKTALEALGIKDSSTVTYQYTRTSGTPNTYCITATNGTTSYKISNTNTAPSAGGCAGHGIGGSNPITNLIVNPGFESNTSNWGASSITVAQASDWFQSGASSVKLTNTSTADTGDIRLSGGSATTFPPGMVPGETYTVSATLRMTAPLSGGHNRSPRVMFFHSINSSSFTEVFGPKANNVAGVQTISHTFTVPANATGVVLGLGGSSSVIGEAVYYDNVIMTQGSTPYSYADGNTANWVWNGTVNNSTSTGPGL